MADVDPLKGQRGWLKVSKFQVMTEAVTREHIILAITSDEDFVIHNETVERLLGVPATIIGTIDDELPHGRLAAAEETHRRFLLQQAEQQNAEWLEVEGEKLDDYADDMERAFEVEVKALEAEIKAAKKAMRGSNQPMTEKLTEKRRITGLEAKRDKMKAEFFDKRAQIRTEVEAMLDKIQASLKMEPSLTPLFTIRWEVV